jgi:hypothetical protein
MATLGKPLPNTTQTQKTQTFHHPSSTHPLTPLSSAFRLVSVSSFSFLTQITSKTPQNTTNSDLRASFRRCHSPLVLRVIIAFFIKSQHKIKIKDQKSQHNVCLCLGFPVFCATRFH